jgi:DNA-binding NtrC family response regulator
LTSRLRRSVDPPILLVEDRDSLRAMLRLALEAQGHTVVEARDQPEAAAALLTTQFGVVLTDLRLTLGDGFGVLRAAKDVDPELPVIVMTAFGSIQDAVAAMKEGALDFLAKPVDPDHLLMMVERALVQRRLAAENILLKEELAQRRGAPQIVGQDAALKHVTLQLHRAAATDITVLLEGESGTGKELFARALHVLSPRADGPFVAINCAAIPENLLETELFGHEKGAFTGAVARKPGKFELAHRGTLFLDEIGDLPLALQAKILRALEEKRYERVGGTLPLQVDVRVVAATNRNLKAAVAAHQYREDLYFRLSVFPITIPPLRDRAADIPMLAKHFIERFCRDVNKSPMALAPPAADELCAYPWPGNVRELQNCIERAVILTEGDTIHARHLHLSFREAPAAAPDAGDDGPWSKVDLSGTLAEASRRAVAEVERRKIEQTLRETGGNRGQAAELLQVSFKTFVGKLKDYGLES